MTSKEALNKLKEYNSVGLTGDNTLFEPIERALEVLDILKTQVVKTEQGWYIDTDCYCFDTDGKENKLIARWLRDDK